MISVSQTFAMAVQQQQAGNLQQAEYLFRQVLQADPQHADALHMYGVLATQAGRSDVGVAYLGKALLVNPDCAEAHANLGNALRNLGRLAEAAASYRQALRLKPDFAGVYSNLGSVLTEQRKAAEAVSVLQQALRLDPNLAVAHNNLGFALSHLGKLEEAAASIKHSLRLRPASPDAYNNLGHVLADQGQQEEAISAFQQALRLQPNFAPAHSGLAMSLLLQGNYEQGWPEWEWRLKCRQIDPPPYRQPLWDGSALDGRTILLYSEQGLGDTLQFIRYAPMVHARGGRVLLACPQELIRVLSGCAGIDRLLPFGTPLPIEEYDVQASLLSLPAIFGTTLATVPAKAPYVVADAAFTENWREELKQYATFKIGIAWQGNPQHLKDYRRSIPLAHFAPLARLEGVQVFSLQKGPGTEQLQPLLAMDGVRVIDLGGKLDLSSNAFIDTAAVMKSLDLVITSDTAIAHLAGALAVPVWVALPFVPDWRWLLDRQDSPWYPTMRLFRQNEPGDWKGVFERIVAAQIEAISARRGA